MKKKAAVIDKARIDAELLALGAARCQNSLKAFATAVWPLIEPVPFVDGWVVDAVCDHLEALTRGDIKKIVINIPPRHSKSTLISVIWRVWVWLQNPSERFLSASYSLNLSIRDNVRVRRIIEDPWFQARYGDLFQLASDQNVKSFFESDRQGYQMATSVNGSTTGNGGSILLLDDPHKADEAYSDVERESALMWFREVWTNRLNDQKRDKMIVVGQRIHENDVCGYILRERPDWVHLNLPATFEPSRRCFTPVVSTSSHTYSWKGADPRQEEGELLWPERFSKEALDGLKRDLGSSGFSAQYQQSPVPAGGGQFKELWFRYANVTQENYEMETPEGVRHIPRKSCRLFMVIDLAISSKQDADYTVIQTWARTPDGEAILIDQVRGHFDNPEQFKLIYAVYGRYLPEFVQVETVAYQLALFQQLIAKNVPCKEYRPVRDKVSRASTAAILFEQGRLYFLKDLLDLQEIKTELLRFPRYDHDDIVDAVAQAADYLTDPANVNANQFVDDMNRRVQINRARELQPAQGFLPQTQQRLPQRAWWDQ